MFLDFIFQIWRRLNEGLQWRSLWLISSKFMLTVAGIILDPCGCVLLQRHRHWVAQVWALPGGIVHGGETLEAALGREVFEETGLRITNIELLSIKSGYQLRLEVFYRARLLECTPPEKLTLQKAEVLEARFFSLDALPEDMLPLQREMLQSLAPPAPQQAG